MAGSNLHARGRRLPAFVWLAVIVLLLSAIPAAAHGKKGQRTISLFDIENRTADFRFPILASNTYLMALMDAGSKANECLTPSFMPPRFFDVEEPVIYGQVKTPADLAQRGDGVPIHGYNIDYRILGEATGAKGSYVLTLTMVTSMQEMMAEVSVPFTNAQDVFPAAEAAAKKLMGSNFADWLRDWEKRRRDDNPLFAMGPTLTTTGEEPGLIKLEPGEEREFEVKLVDCDEFKLKDRQIELRPRRGKVDPVKLTVGKDGTVKFKYTAPQEPGDDQVIVTFPFEYPSERLGREQGPVLDFKVLGKWSGTVQYTLTRTYNRAQNLPGGPGESHTRVRSVGERLSATVTVKDNEGHAAVNYSLQDSTQQTDLMPDSPPLRVVSTNEIRKSGQTQGKTDGSLTLTPDGFWNFEFITPDYPVSSTVTTKVVATGGSAKVPPISISNTSTGDEMGFTIWAEGKVEPGATRLSGTRTDKGQPLPDGGQAMITITWDLTRAE